MCFLGGSAMLRMYILTVRSYIIFEIYFLKN